MSLYDFHVHSTHSDGSLNLTEIVALAEKKHMKGFALTDHDNVAGVNEVISLAKKARLQIIPGVELTTMYMDYRLDILGYGIDISNPKLLARLVKTKEERLTRSQIQVDKIVQLGFRVDAEKIKEEERSLGGFGTKKLVEMIHSDPENLKKISNPGLKGFFNEYLKNGRPAYVPLTEFSSVDAIKLIHECGGIASFAHPAESVEDFEALEKIIRSLAKAGLDGIEVYSPKHDMEHVAFIHKLATELDLITTFGSDFHGKDDMHADLGSLEIPDEGVIVGAFLDKLSSGVR